MGDCKFKRVCTIPNHLKEAFAPYVKKICETERHEDCVQFKMFSKCAPKEGTAEWDGWMKKVKEARSPRTLLVIRA